MELASKDYIINTIFRTNILPIISECNTSCIFCSHKQNPREVEVFRLPKLNLGDFKELLDFLSPNKKIIIGEAATRIIEGEPLLHKEFLDIIALIRNKFKSTPIQITTNGILLTDELVESLVRLGNIELNISVNCINMEKRKKVLGIKDCVDISEKIGLIKNRLRFSGSMVYVPDLLGMDDVEEVIRLLDSCGADSVRVFLPGVSNMAENIPDFTTIYNDMYIWIKAFRQKYSVPIVIEPSIIKDLDCKVEGVVAGSPAQIAGIRTEDIIVEINGEEVGSRVDAFNKAFSLSNPVLRILRHGEHVEVKLKKAKNSPPGFVVLYDIDTELVDQIQRIVERNFLRKDVITQEGKINRVLFLTSELAIDILKTLFSLKPFNFSYDVKCVKNRYFGGTIMCGGLLTVQDVMKTLEEEIYDKEKPDLIILPGIMFDFKKRDLLGRNIKDIEDKFGIPVDTV